ncbi:hypothetical protein MMP64_08345 [Acinetobacter sp. ANC 5659]|uniref:hypothetical protein n=1 Tax=Acinetobacter higginsii TaxID=70347 RepID=UPI001F4B1497|nr:hypothetical protein [Acinetobacter higginsii]MCH7317948.1 hypothetical protein [Acinetobacter higginsii]
MTCTVYKLKDANFTGQGLPNIFPFVAKDSLDYAFNFSGKYLKDLTAKTPDLVPYRTNSLTGGGSRVVDPTVLTQALNGLGIRLANGCLVTSVPFAPIPIGGARKLSLLFVGGWDGTTIENPNTTPGISVFFDIGNGVTSSNAPMMQYCKTDKTLGARLRSASSSNIGSTISNETRQYFMILTFDGDKWSLHNKTLNTVITKTNAELGITGTIGVASGSVPLFDHFGHGHISSTIAALPMIICKAAKWNKALTNDEIDLQYQMSKSIFGDLI